MESRGGFIFDSLVYGIRTSLSQVRLICFSILFIVVAFLLLVFFGKLLVPLGFNGLGTLIECCMSRICPMDALMQFIARNYLYMTIALFLQIILFVWAWLGFIRIALDVYDTGDSRLSQFASVVAYLPKAMLAVFVFLVVTIAGLFALVIPGIVWFIRAGYFMWFILDRDTGIIASFKKSIDVTRGKAWYLFGQLLVFQFLSMSILGISIAIFSSAYVYRYLAKR